MPQLNSGFVCLSEVKGLIRYPVKALVDIAAGDALQDDGAGFAQLGLDNLTSTEFLGVAAEAVDNSSGGDGDLYVQIIPPLRHYRFYVPNEDATAAADTDRGEIVDLASEDGVDVTDDALTTGWGFWIDEVDTTNDHVYGYFRLAG